MPRQPELRRSGLGETEQEGRRRAREAKRRGRARGDGGPVPENNRPGHRPEKEQDKPQGLDRPRPA